MGNFGIIIPGRGLKLNYYGICFILSIILAAVFIFRITSTKSVDLALFFVFAGIANFGYWERSISQNLSHAIFAQQITYIGGCYATLSILFIILFLCKIKIYKVMRFLLILSSTAVFITSLTIGKSTIFYKSVKLFCENGTSKLIREYGVFHQFFYVLLIACYVYSFAALFVGIKRKREVSIKAVSKLLLIASLGIFSYFGSGLLFEVDLIPLWYVISGTVFILIQNTIGLYNIDKTIIDSMLMHNTFGVVSFDLNYNFLGCNDRAKEIYHPLQKLIVDKKVDPDDYELKELDSWIDFFKRNIKSEFYYKKNNNFYKVDSKPLYVGKKHKGYQLIFSDCTEEKNRESNLIKISITDELTKLFNRRAFEEEIEKIQSDGIPEDFTILSFDLNGLKAANDTKGHAAGDELIIESAKTLNAVIESYGYVYRTGGDEYIAIAICTKEQQEEIFSLIDNYSKLWKGTYSTGLSISKGAASITEFPDYSIDQLEKEAEQRMYKDKTRYYLESGIERRKR